MFMCSFLGLSQTNISVDCAVGPENVTYCYTDNDTTTYVFTSTDGSSLNFTVNSGNVENRWDAFIVYDSDGTTNLNATDPYGNAGDLAGITFQSTGDSISFTVDSDGSVNCQTRATINPIDVTVTCATCVNPSGTFATVSNCSVGPEFFVDTNLTNLGSATNITIQDNQGNSQMGITATGTVRLGPYPNNTNVVISVLNQDDSNCVITSAGLTQEICLDNTIICSAGSQSFNYCYTANDTNVFTFTSDTGFPLTFTFNSGNVENNFDELIVRDTDGTLLVPANYYGNNGDLSGLSYTSSGDTITIAIQSDGSVSCSSSANIMPIDATIICQTCVKPNVTFNAYGDCAANPNAPEFFIDVDIIDFGTVTTVQVVDDQGGVGQLPTGPGVLTFGPYPAGQDVIIEVSTDDVNCIEFSDALTILCPSPPNECSMVFAGDDQTLACDVSTANLDASFQLTGQDFNVYEINGLSSCPTPPIAGGAPTSLEIDDRWSDTIDMGFDFCFFGDTYNQLIVGANGGVSFDVSNAGQSSGWSFDEQIPNNSNNTLANVNIFAAYHDINPQTCGDVNFSVLGSAPSRQFVINYNEVCQFSCTTQLASMQVILYEGSNNIDINVFNKPQCDWNSGSAVIGVQNMAGDIAFSPVGRNTGDWSATDEFYRFSPGQSTTPNYIFEWYDDNGIFLSSDEMITVNPTQTTTYTATMTYSQCAGPNITVSDEVTITVPEAVTSVAPSSLDVCDNDNDGFSTFDLTQVEMELFNGQTGVTATYHLTQADADSNINPIATPTAFTNTTVNTQTIYVSVVNTMSGCSKTEQFIINSFVSPLVNINTSIPYEVCPNATEPISITAEALNFNVNDVTIEWDLDGTVLNGEDALTINSVLLQGDYTITVTDNVTTCTASSTVNVVELVSCVIPQGISPNNDGLNDRFDLSSYSVQSLEVFNRNGRKVFIKSDGYKDEWFGQTDDGDELPTGTYYYIMKYRGNQVKASYIYINR